MIDTLADVFPADENNRTKVRQFVSQLRGLALRQGCAVLVLAHPSLSGLNSGSGTSGSTAWSASVRSRLYLSRITEKQGAERDYEPDRDARILSTKKANYARTGDEIALKWQNGVFVAEAPPSPQDRKAASAKAERVFLKLFDEFSSKGRRLNSRGGPNYAPTLFADDPDAEGVTKRALTTAMKMLLRKGTIQDEEEGPRSRRVSRLVRA